MAKDSLRRDSSREGLKAKGRSRRKAVAGHAEAEKASGRSRRNDILPSLRIEPCPVDTLKLHDRKLRKNNPAHVREEFAGQYRLRRERIRLVDWIRQSRRGRDAVEP